MNEPDSTRDQKLAATRVRMAELASRFLDRTEVDIASMRSGLGRLASGDAGPLNEIRHLAHRMVGTGATLGFESLSERARAIERLTEGCTAGVVPDDATRAQLLDALDALCDEFSRQLGRRDSTT
jgi:chemotaxis protein histidine kinase CheA